MDIGQKSRLVGEMSSPGLQTLVSDLDRIEMQFSISPVVLPEQSNSKSTTFRRIENKRENQCTSEYHEDSNIEMMTGLHIAEEMNIGKEVELRSQSSTTVHGNEMMNESETSNSGNEDTDIENNSASNKRHSKFGDVNRNVKGRYNDSAC